MINYNDTVKLPDLKLELAKPNFQVIGILKHAYNIRQNLKLRELNEITFTLPYYIMKNHKHVINPLIGQLKSKHLVKKTWKDEVEWFILSDIKESDGNKKLTCDVTITSLGYQLTSKKIRLWPGVEINDEYRKESLNAEQVINNLLSPTSWSIKSIDPDFIITYRAFDFSNTNVLEALYSVAEKFNAVIVWDTSNKQLSLIKEENAGTFKGGRITINKYLKSISKQVKINSPITRLKVYGQDGISIQEVNPLGTDYLEDYSYFMQGFERDSNKNVISSSKFGMSDELCSALLDYNELISNYKSEFARLLELKETKQRDLTPIQNKIVELLIELEDTNNLIDINNSTNNDNTELLAKKSRIETELSQYQSSETSINGDIRRIDNDIISLKQNVSINSYIPPSLLIELDDFICEEIWEESAYTSPADMIKDAQKVFEDLKKPQHEITMDLINFYNTYEGKKDWDRFDLGDKFIAFHEELNIDITTQIIEQSIGHDDNSISITFTNTKSNVNDDDKFVKQLINSINISNTVDMNKYAWSKVYTLDTDVRNYMNGKLNAAKQEIVAGQNENIIINERGITATDNTDPDRYLRIMHSVIGMTDDGGNTFRLAITPDGVYAKELVGQILIGENLYMENASGKFRFDHDGVVIDGSSFKMLGGENGISIDTENGLVITKSDNKVKASFNSTDGIKVQIKEGTVWKDSFYYDTSNSSLVVNGVIYAKDLKIGGQSVLTQNDLIKGSYIDKISTDQISIGTAKISTAMIETLEVGRNVIMGANASISWSNVSSKPTISDLGGLSASDRRLTYIDANGIYTGTLTADRINGGTISGVTINVSTDAKVGNTLSIGDSSWSGSKYIRFNNSIYLEGRGDVLTFYTSGGISFPSSASFSKDVDFSSAYISGEPRKTATEVGYCGVGALNSAGTTGNVAGVGVNFRMRRYYSPSGVSLSTSSSSNSAVDYTSVTSDGFWLYVTGNGTTDSYSYWRGTYTVN